MIITGTKNGRSIKSTDDSCYYFEELSEIFPIKSDVVNPGKDSIKKGLELYKNILIAQIQDLNYTRIDPIFNENPKLFQHKYFYQRIEFLEKNIFINLYSEQAKIPYLDSLACSFRDAYLGQEEFFHYHLPQEILDNYRESMRATFLKDSHWQEFSGDLSYADVLIKHNLIVVGETISPTHKMMVCCS